MENEKAQGVVKETGSDPSGGASSFAAGMLVGMLIGVVRGHPTFTGDGPASARFGAYALAVVICFAASTAFVRLFRRTTWSIAARRTVTTITGLIIGDVLFAFIHSL